MRPAALVVLAGLLASAALAQQDQPVAPAPVAPATNPAPAPAAPAGPVLAPPPPDIGPAVQGPPKVVKPKAKPAETKLVEPPKPEVIRSPVAVLQVLDKVTAETMRFEAPVGRPVRYKNLVVQVRACETRDYDEPAPRASAYLVVDTRAGPDGGAANNQVFRGWMFAFTPSLHALHHPTYDLWLIACSAAAPST